MNPEIVLINPWIYDFAAYDLWAKPLGLLYLASRIRAMGFTVHFIDCLDVHNPLMQYAGYKKKPIRRFYGTGKYWKQNALKPSQLSSISRTYNRYGISPQLFKQELKKAKKPKAILVTSLMTYWYPGVFEAIHLAKKIYPDIPVILGGIYAALCPEHARTYSGADLIISSSDRLWPAELSAVLKSISDFTHDEKIEPFHPYPAFDLLTKIDYISLLSSFGCPFNCPYCASHYLSPLLYKREPLELFEEVLYWHKNYHVMDFAFYDDALLLDAANHICIFLEELLKTDLTLRFHCPNGLHIACIDKDVAELLCRAGFLTIRLGFET
ncbi:MAG TPA: hypothetical protein VMW42_11990, partial [Desulfatiglandales bacterium]|nr:hypothetical protein [Desulfatiglandales bacterium]